MFLALQCHCSGQNWGHCGENSEFALTLQIFHRKVNGIMFPCFGPLMKLVDIPYFDYISAISVRLTSNMRLLELGSHFCSLFSVMSNQSRWSYSQVMVKCNQSHRNTLNTHFWIDEWGVMVRTDSAVMGSRIVAEHFPIKVPLISLFLCILCMKVVDIPYIEYRSRRFQGYWVDIGRTGLEATVFVVFFSIV